MKILNINTFIDPVTGGGTAERTLQMSRHLANEGHQVSILTTDYGLYDRNSFEDEPFDCHLLKCIEERFFLISPSSIRILHRLIRDADIVHIMGHWTLLNALAYRAVRRNKCPYVVCPAGALPIFGRSKKIKRLYNFLIGRKIIRNANMCIAVTRQETSQFSDYGVPSSKISVIPNGLDSTLVPPPCPGAHARLGLPKRPFFLFLGRLNPIKGPDLLLEAYSHLKNPIFDLVFVGPDGGLLAELRKKCTDWQLDDNVYFIGPLHGNDKYSAYYAASAFIVPSRREAMSIVALEAGITGTPVLLTNQCGFDEVEACGGGLVVPASVQGIQGGLEKMIQENAELLNMGTALKDFVLKSYTWDILIQNYNELYKEILEKNLR